ncbi:hypothetical protein NDU88_005531 [Pleurodeles waltl]|uniref:Uncharacterized protein n=1 Tax=Pleurodeles waltl TaxID=8319 RepID=A0AAV7NN19_PLEWA|nr:hypothetical protein NDU88_005531 [Pleurodeles waltl]
MCFASLGCPAASGARRAVKAWREVYHGRQGLWLFIFTNYEGNAVVIHAFCYHPPSCESISPSKSILPLLVPPPVASPSVSSVFLPASLSACSSQRPRQPVPTSVLVSLFPQRPRQPVPQRPHSLFPSVLSACSPNR